MSREVKLCISDVGGHRLALIVDELAGFGSQDESIDAEHTIDTACIFESDPEDGGGGERRAVFMQDDGGEKKQFLLGSQVSLISVDLTQIFDLPELVSVLGRQAGIAGLVRIEDTIVWLLNHEQWL